MSYQVLARKWRPKKFEDVIGQDHITRTLKNAIAKDKVAHAYLFTGTRGVGKTTIARIFAKALMCQNKDEKQNPCLTCESCVSIDQSNAIDYIEVDGASNNSVENIRELIDNVQYLPTRGKYKVYVIDEVHMLSTSAFNALLKTLEEPPAHVIFIFATTDPQKLLGTVISRCQRFDFKSVSEEILKQHITNIARVEGFQFESDKVLAEISKYGKGSVRDTLSLLDQVLSLSLDEVVTEESLVLSLGLANSELINNLITSILIGDSQLTLKAFKTIMSQNVDFKKLSTQLLEAIFAIIENIDDNTIVTDNFNISSELLEQLSLAELLWVYESLSKDLDWSLTSTNIQMNIEVSLLKVTLRRQLLSEDPVKLTKKKAENLISIEPLNEEEKVVEVTHSEAKESDIQILNEEIIEPEDDLVEERTWQSFTEYLFTAKRTLAVNVERGNLLEDLDLSREELNVSLGFSKESQIFYDFVQDVEGKKELKSQIASYFGKIPEQVSITVDLLTEEEKEEKNFLSKVEVDQKNEAIKKEEQRQKLLNNEYIKEAEKLFSSQVNKIILNENNLGE